MSTSGSASPHELDITRFQMSRRSPYDDIAWLAAALCRAPLAFVFVLDGAQFSLRGKYGGDIAGNYPTARYLPTPLRDTTR